jgi:hypothetical protein
MMTVRKLYKVIFASQGKVYEIYARHVQQADIYGFVEIEEILFGEKSTLLVDPSEEQLKNEFNGVTRSYIPFHAVIRIDEVEKEGRGKILQLASGENITQLPHPILNRKNDPEK